MPTKAEELWKSLGGPGSVSEARFKQLDELDPTGWTVQKGPSLDYWITYLASIDDTCHEHLRRAMTAKG